MLRSECSDGECRATSGRLTGIFGDLELGTLVLPKGNTRVAFVPSLRPLEIANVLLVGERRNRSTQAQAAKFLASLAEMPITVDDETHLHAWSSVLSLAREQNLTAYDAAYLELALRRGLSLATLDEQLKAAAQIVGVLLHAVQ